MWNPEARDFSPIIFTFMSSWERTKMPRGGGQGVTEREKSTAVEDFARYSVEAAQDAAAWDGGEWRRQKIRCDGGSRYATQGNGCPRCHRRLEGGEQDAVAAPPGRRRTRDTRATKSTAAEELAPALGEIAEKS
jgi:hypothetical protein